MLTRTGLVFAAAAALLLIQEPGAASAPVVARVSIATDGSDAYGDSPSPSISADGRFIAFASHAPNLIPGDNNNAVDVFVRDEIEGTTERVSVASDGAEANGGSWGPRISGDGRYVAFISAASNLDSWAVPGAFIHDRLTGSTELVSLKNDGTPGLYGVHEIDLSSNGRFVAMSSDDQLTPDDGTSMTDIFVRDRETGRVSLASRAPDGSQFQTVALSPSLANDGTLVFSLFYANLPTVPPGAIPYLYLHDFESGITSYLFLAEGQAGINASSPNIPFPNISISDDGNYIAFLGRTAGLQDLWDDVFVYNRVSMTAVKASLATGGGDPYGAARSLAITADGRYVTYSSDATDLVAGDGNACEDIFRWDSLTAATTRVSVALDGGNANHLSRYPTISADGRYVTFESWARNLVADDHNGDLDVFLADSSNVLSSGDSVLSTDTTEPRCGPDPGDTNCNGTVTATDALAVLRYVAGLRPWGECVRLVGSVNCDGQLTAVDALWILRAVAGLIELPTTCGK